MFAVQVVQICPAADGYHVAYAERRLPLLPELRELPESAERVQDRWG